VYIIAGLDRLPLNIGLIVHKGNNKITELRTILQIGHILYILHVLTEKYEGNRMVIRRGHTIPIEVTA
jgi:hypothetical protein